MSYAKLISSVITALTYGLEIGICIGNQFLELDEKGFYFIKENDSEKVDKHYLSIPDVINFLFKKIIYIGDSSTPLITYMIGYLDYNNIKDVPSFIEFFYGCKLSSIY